MIPPLKNYPYKLQGYTYVSKCDITYEKLFEKDKYVKNMLILSNGVHCQNIPIWLQYDILIGNLTNTFH